MITSCNHLGKPTYPGHRIQVLTFFQVSLLLLGIIGLFKVGGLPKVSGIVMLSLSGATFIADFAISRAIRRRAAVDDDEDGPKINAHAPELISEYGGSRPHYFLNGSGLKIPVYYYDEIGQLPSKNPNYFFYFPKTLAPTLENIAFYNGRPNSGRYDDVQMLLIYSEQNCFTKVGQGQFIFSTAKNSGIQKQIASQCVKYERNLQS